MPCSVQPSPSGRASRRERAGVRAGVGLGQRERGYDVAARHAGEPAVAGRVVAGLEDRVAAEALQRERGLGLGVDRREQLAEQAQLHRRGVASGGSSSRSPPKSPRSSPASPRALTRGGSRRLDRSSRRASPAATDRTHAAYSCWASVSPKSTSHVTHVADHTRRRYCVLTTPVKNALCSDTPRRLALPTAPRKQPITSGTIASSGGRMRIAVIGGGPGGLYFSALAQQLAATTRRGQPRDHRVGAQRRRRHLRLRRGVQRRDPRRHRARRPGGLRPDAAGVRDLGRHRRPLQGRGRDQRRARVRGDEPAAAAGDPPGALPRARRHLELPDRGTRRRRARRVVRPGRGRRRPQLRRPRAVRRHLPPDPRRARLPLHLARHRQGLRGLQVLRRARRRTA